VNWFQTVVGIDPSGKRLALAAVRAGFGRPALCAPPQVSTLRGEKEQQLLSEAEGILGDFVARNGLAGSAARLCVPADRVYSARVLFPPIREKDLRPALELELERLFPFPSSRLRFGWQRLAAKAGGGKNVTLVVMAAQADYIEWWEDIVSRAGLRLGGAIPSGWALSSALSFANQGRWDQRRLTAVFREAGETVECSVLAGRVPVFSAYRQCAAESMPADGLSLLTEGLVDVPFPEDDAAVDLVAPPGWFGAEDGETGGKISFRVAGDFSPFPAFPTDGQGGAEETVPAGKIAGAFGAAPAATYWKTKGELSRLDAEIAALRPVVADVEEAVGTLREVEAKISLLREASAGRGESFVILKELTERLPDGTWLTGLRVEDRKVEMNGISPSANEIFPLLTRDGRFRGVTFASPITRQADNLERFRIRAEFVPGSAPDEEGAR
jgi:hypothetical protein